MNDGVNRFLEQAGIRVPLLCGAMYPCSNPELVAAVSHAGGMGIVQPLSMVFVHKHEFRAGMRLIKGLTDKPVGMNVITEKSSKVYQERMSTWLDVALDEGVRFFVTSLGNPKWVIDRVRPHGGIVYHDVTERKWADKALEAGVDGLIAVNSRAGGHAGPKSPADLMAELGNLGVPLLCAGGIGSPADFRSALDMGYAGVQMGTRFIATTECTAHDDYKQAIVKAHADDIVLSEKITGVPVAIIKTPYIERTGTKAGPIARMLLAHRKTKHWMRMVYSLQALWKLKNASVQGMGYGDYWQAGKSVDGVAAIEPAGDIVARFEAALQTPSLT